MARGRAAYSVYYTASEQHGAAVKPRSSRAALPVPLYSPRLSTCFVKLMLLRLLASLPLSLSHLRVCSVLERERSMVYRERTSRMYSSWAYALAAGLVELPWMAAIALVFVSINYWMVGLRADAGIFFTYVLVFWQVSLFFNFLGMVGATSSPLRTFACHPLSLCASATAAGFTRRCCCCSSPCHLPSCSSSHSASRRFKWHKPQVASSSQHGSCSLAW